MKSPHLVAALCLTASILHAADTAETVYNVFNPHPDLRRTADGAWVLHDMERPRPPKVAPKPETALAASAKAPTGAVVLFDGRDLSAWNVPPPVWSVIDGVLKISPPSSLVSKEPLGSGHLHLEWRTSDQPHKKGQDRGNSGVFLMGLYEIQVLDTHDNITYADGMTAAMYGVRPPSVDAQRPSGEWQYYDIWFQRPIFDAAGKLVRPARVTVDVNGVRVHEDAAFEGPANFANHMLRKNFEPHADKLPLTFQYHGEEVWFRNVWFKPLPDTGAAPHLAK